MATWICDNPAYYDHYDEDANPNEVTAVVEVLDVSVANNIKREQWVLTDQLPLSVAYHRAVAFNGDVLVVGGGYINAYGDWSNNDRIMAIDTTTHSVRFCGQMSGAYMQTPLVMSGDLYVFGGMSTKYFAGQSPVVKFKQIVS